MEFCSQTFDLPQTGHLLREVKGVGYNKPLFLKVKLEGNFSYQLEPKGFICCNGM